MGEQKLKRCPFCGGEAEWKEDEFLDHQRVYIKCKSCRALSVIEVEGWTMAFKDHPARYISIEECREKVIENWNRRVREDFAVVAGGVSV